MTRKVSKGLAFPMVSLPGVGYMLAKGEDEQEAAQLLYAVEKRDGQRLVIRSGGDEELRLRPTAEIRSGTNLGNSYQIRVHQ